MKLALLKAVVQDESVRNNPSLFFDKNPAENEEKLKITRQVTSILYLAKREDLVRPVMQWIDRTLLQTKYEHFYDVQFTEHAPDTASVWVQTKYYNDWENMETRFYPYGSVSNHSHKKDVEFHLKGAETKKLDDTYRAGVHFLADKRGLHIYVRLNTPETEQIRAGLAKGGTLECLFKPGYDEAYHQWFFQNLPGTGEPTEPIWDCPNGKYQLTTDVMQKDSCITDEACAAHTFIPWEYFCSSLPLNGNMWYYGLQIWDKDSKTLSGSVHEQERMIRLRFHFTKEQELAVKRFCAIRAYSKYKAVRQDKNGFIEAWKTDLLGDPEFYSECLEQYLRELDEAGETLLKTDSDAQTDSIFNQYASDWMNIRWKIDSMRTKYLKKKFSAL